MARIFGFNFSGFIAWWLWRTIYLSKLPRLEKKLRVALDWTLDLFFPKDGVQFLTLRAPSVSDQEHAYHSAEAGYRNNGHAVPTISTQTTPSQQ